MALISNFLCILDFMQAKRKFTTLESTDLFGVLSSHKISIGSTKPSNQMLRRLDFAQNTCRTALHNLPPQIEAA